MKNVLKILILIAILISSCEPSTRYKILTTLFDGVPPYEEWLKGKKEEKRPERPGEWVVEKKGPVIMVVYHKPYSDNRCPDCHNPLMGNRTVVPREELCFKCHPSFKPEPAKFSHGPVGAGMCLSCHNPHASENPKLLLVKKQDLCKGCHEGMEKGEYVHPPVMDGDCGLCHDLSHSKGKAFMLKGETSEVCSGCHGDKMEGLYVHGPAAVGDCLMCHRTHKGSHGLLINRTQELCGQCHDLPEIKRKTSHKGIGNRECFNCHNPHNGENRFFIKKG